MDINIMNLLKRSITESMIEALRDGEMTLETIELKEFLSCEINSPYVFGLMKAIGLVHFADNKEAQLIINDFIGLLNDMYDDGELSLELFKRSKR